MYFRNNIIVTEKNPYRLALTYQIFYVSLRYLYHSITTTGMKTNRMKLISLVICMLALSPAASNGGVPAKYVQQAKPNQVLPGIFEDRFVQFKKKFKMEGKNYTLYFLDVGKNVRAKKNIVTNIYLLPDDFSLIVVQGEAQNYPPSLKKFIYHDLGDPDRDYCTAILHENICDKNGENSKFIDREVRLPDEIANDIISLFSGDTELRVLDRMLGIYSEVTTP